MKFATFMLNENVHGEPPGDVLRNSIHEAVLAEEIGFDAVWLAEHHFSDYGVAPSTAVLAAAIAARTSTIRIGTGVLVLPFQDPLRVAEDFALVDQISDGRLDFGVGRGYQPHEYKGFGIPMSESRDRFDEALAIIEGLWSNETFTYEGKFHSVDEVSLMPRPLQQPTPPIWVAAVSPDSFERVARMGKPFMSAPSIAPLDKVRECYDLYSKTLAEEGITLDPQYPIQRHVYIGENEEDAYETPKDPFMWYQNRNQQLMSSADANDPSYAFYQKAQRNKADLDYHRVASSDSTLLCTAEVAIERIKHIKDELDLNYLLGTFQFGGLPREKAEASMRRFAEDVMPAFQ
jgi:alkanesulfonate monooxygenase SsuD/methylene tetrahydromethanopterin reductase-like flavin-dependent oxidoreductase (luciferase family)